MTATSHKDTSGLEVRRARPEDRDAVLAFCTQTWDDGDYIEEVWDEWVADERNTLLVGALDGVPVALEHVRIVGEDEAWLEGIRVDPSYRRRGFGRVMISRGLVAAREMGATVARLLTSSTNVATQRLADRFGMVKIAEMIRYGAPALKPDESVEEAAAEVAPLTTPGEQDFERIWSWLEQSNLAPLNGGLEMTDWHAEALTEPLVRGYWRRGRLRCWRSGRRLARSRLPCHIAGTRRRRGRCDALYRRPGRFHRPTGLRATTPSRRVELQ